MRAIGTGKRGGALPGFTTGFTLGTGNAWTKQIGARSLNTIKCRPKRTPQGLQGHALRMWRQACKATGTSYKYTLTLCERRYITLSNGLIIYIDKADGTYNHSWESVAIRLIRKGK